MFCLLVLFKNYQHLGIYDDDSFSLKYYVFYIY